MERCACCNKLILLGGRRHRGHRFCNERCFFRGRLLISGDIREDDLAGMHDVIVELRDDLNAVAADVAEQRISLADAVERLDFLERALAQLREESA